MLAIKTVEKLTPRITASIFTTTSDTNFPLSSLFARSNTEGIDSAKKRIPDGSRTNIPFASSATNTSMITIASPNSRTIEHFFTSYDNTYDAIKIRVSGNNLFYFTNPPSS